ncbi:MAG TPA: hypothetical protein PLR54_05235 [Spirochaetota bacterium]|nr:hypothetical protein [Spirochaetota bacterium]HOM87641.1 hypothetical protein [Spirochaetota bacterium]HQG41991.1 hypothetical protein [Spirochaetota bacterium]HQK07053.1 hypothetical protein [Spirochaetota bacterium]HRV15158.1 hypothetical protein [Spirochaetota bacterium]
MKDPLNNYNFNELYNDYDSHCKKYDPNSQYLEYFDPKPNSDRQCYNLISKEVKEKFESIKKDPKQNFPIKLLIAILYWKLYSQPAAVKNICYKLYNDTALQKRTDDEFNKYIKYLPCTITKNIEEIIKHLESFNNYKIYGAITNMALPVRTTILHFIYPNEISIFDKMVLQAVGVKHKNANQDINIYKEYQQFVWGLAKKYKDKMSLFFESSLRVIDMALWINRGD